MSFSAELRYGKGQHIEENDVSVCENEAITATLQKSLISMRPKILSIT